MKNKQARDLFISLSFGDGYIDASGGLLILHGVAQKEYLEWKADKLSSAGFPRPVIKYRDNNGYGAYHFRVAGGKYGKLIHRIKKSSKCPLRLFKRLGVLGLAIWYMDDGSLSNRRSKEGVVKSSLLTISTCVDSMEENQVLIDYLKTTYGVVFYQRKMKGKYALVCGTHEGRKFIDLIKDYVGEIPCMRYKLDIKR